MIVLVLLIILTIPMMLRAIADVDSMTVVEIMSI